MELNKEQKEAVECIDKNLQIVACAGSGKTEVITRRIVNILLNDRNIKPENIVAFTFTNMAADNMKKRIQQKIVEAGINIDVTGMYIGTIHAFCKYVLDKYIEKYSEYRILDTPKEHLFIMKYFRECGAETLGLGKANISLYATCIEKMVEMYDRKDEWSEDARNIFYKYYDLLCSKKFLDFSMLILELIKHSEDEPICKFYDTIKYLIVDEYQDIDDLQEKLIYTISKHGANICVVGDDDQTIYQFRGSNASNMINFAKKYQDVRIINLDTNYRSCKAIIDVADSVIKNNKNRIKKNMHASVGMEGGIIEGRCKEGLEEYDVLARDLERLHKKGIAYADMSILIRKRSRLNDMVNRLESYGIPLQIENNISFFESHIYEKYCNIFKYLQNPSDETRQILIDNWVNDVEGKSLKTAYKKLCLASEKNMLLLDVFEEFMKALGVSEKDYEEGQKLFKRILNDFDQIYGYASWSVRLNAFVMYLERNVEDEYKHIFIEQESKKDAVQIMTIHKSKGLEFEAVFIPDLQHGFFPSKKIGGKKYYSVLGGVFEKEKGKYETTKEDERKLFYVAVTRAKKYLYVYADVEKEAASLFLREMNRSSYCNIDIPKKE